MFFISLFLVVISSYLIMSVLMKNCTKTNLSFIYFILTAFAQIVLSFEILSLLSAISAKNILLCNFAILIIACLCVYINKAEIFKPDIKNEADFIKSALKKDKLLKLCAGFFIVFLVSQFILALLQPINFGDALVYYLPRCTNWIMTGSISHIDTTDVRQLIMPVNMEFLYTWNMLFNHTAQGSAVFAYLGFLNAVYVIYNLLGEFKLCRRRRLWTIFVFSSFAIIGLMSHTPCADLFIGSLILTSVYLFLVYCKHDNKISLYFSSLAYALAIGTKFTASIPMPVLFVLCLLILFKYRKNDIKQTAVYFTLFFAVNFVLFSSYSYILNVLHFGHIAGSNSSIIINQFRGGFKGYICNLINYFFLMFDVSGMPKFDILADAVTYLRNVAIGWVKPPADYISPYYPDLYTFKADLIAVYSLLGFIGLFTFYPSIVYLIRKNYKKYLILKYFAAAFILTVMFFAGVMFFTKFNARYIVTFIVISSPVIACSYLKSDRKIYKWFICVLMFIYLFLNPLKEASANVFLYFKQLGSNEFYKNYNEAEKVYEYLINKGKYKIAVIEGDKNKMNFYADKFKLQNYTVDKILIEKLKEYNLQDYDYIISSNEEKQQSSYIYYRLYNSDNYITECYYLDRNKEKINLEENTDISKSIRVYCKIPFDYIENQGFEKDNDIVSSDFIVYKRK